MAVLSSTRLFYASVLLQAGPSPLLGVPEGIPSRRFKVFGMVAIPNGLQTGLALTNPHARKTARIHLVLRNMEGVEIRRTALELPPMANTSG